MACKPGDSFRRIYDELGAFEGNRLMPLENIVCCRDEASGRSLAVTADLDRLSADMKALSPEDAGAIDELVEGSRALTGFDTGIPKPAEIKGKLDSLKEIWQVRGLLKYVLRCKRCRAWLIFIWPASGWNLAGAYPRRFIRAAI